MQLSFFDICSTWSSSIKQRFSPVRFKKAASLKSRRPKRQRLASSELLDLLWLELANTHFPEAAHLKEYKIGWSTSRQKRTLASCSIEQKTVRVARELNYPALQQWLEPLVYHEMCHAVLGATVPIRNRKRCWHGPEFKQLECKHPGIAKLDQWIKDGGWTTAVRSDRAKRTHAARK